MYGVVFSMGYVKTKYYGCLLVIFFIWILETCIIVFMAFKSPVHWNLIIQKKRGPPVAFFHWKFCVDHQVSLITLEYVYKTVLTWTTKTTTWCINFIVKSFCLFHNFMMHVIVNNARVCKFYWWVESVWLLLHKFWSHFGIFGVKYHNEKRHFQTCQTVLACIHYREGYTK